MQQDRRLVSTAAKAAGRLRRRCRGLIMHGHGGGGAVWGRLFSLLLSFAAINLRADQTIGGTALNLMAPALVLFFIRIIANQNTLQMADRRCCQLVHDQKDHVGLRTRWRTWASWGRPSSTEGLSGHLPVHPSFPSFWRSCCIRPASACGCAACGENPQAADCSGHQRSTKCAMPAPPSRALWREWAALSTP